MAATVHSQPHDIAPLITPDATATVSPDSYIVVFKDGFKSSDFSSKAKQAQHQPQNDDESKDGLWDEISKGIKHSIDLATFQALAGRFTAEALAEIRQHPAVAFVEHDTIGQRLSPSSQSKTREYRSWGLSSATTVSSSSTIATSAVSIAAVQSAVLDTRSARIYLYGAQEDGEGTIISVADADMTFGPQDLKADDDADSTPELSTSTTNTAEKDTTATVTTMEQNSSSNTLVFKLAEETQLVCVSTLRSNGDGTVSDFIAVVDYIVRNQIMRKGGVDEKDTRTKSALIVPFAFNNSRAMVLAVTNAFDSGLNLALRVMAASSSSTNTTTTECSLEQH
ncbi:serine protease [Linnemannia gamsii]|uniref:Serine protease n=1 Tax=Linnemannia gamsii TaxID=64522 RepID=A0ABQ7JP26_9FUNG|nr:serine protease [Linnemannia gamsii]